jgi:hypothetical protein
MPFRSVEVAWEVSGPSFSLLIISTAYTKRNKENKKEKHTRGPNNGLYRRSSPCAKPKYAPPIRGVAVVAASVTECGGGLVTCRGGVLDEVQVVGPTHKYIILIDRNIKKEKKRKNIH